MYVFGFSSLANEIVLFCWQGGKVERRKIPVASNRYTPLKENWMKIFTPVVEHLHLQIRFNLSSRNVEIKVSNVFLSLFLTVYDSRVCQFKGIRAEKFVWEIWTVCCYNFVAWIACKFYMVYVIWYTQFITTLWSILNHHSSQLFS